MRTSLQAHPTNYIHFDSPVVAQAIAKDGEYKSNDVTVKRWGEEKGGDKNLYLISAEVKPLKFSGIINPFLKDKDMV